MAEIRNQLHFDAGIEQISMSAGAGPERLPDRAAGIAPESHYTQQLNELLFPPSLEQSLLESFRPEIMNRRILGPVDYHAALHNCHHELQALAEQRGGAPESEALQRAADELSHESELCLLLATHRHLLQQA